MDPEPFKNKNGSIYKKEKIVFIWARIKPLIHDEIKCVGALLWVTIYTDFERVVLNAEDIIRNQTFSSKNLGGHQKRGHSSSNTGQT